MTGQTEIQLVYGMRSDAQINQLSLRADLAPGYHDDFPSCLGPRLKARGLRASAKGRRAEGSVRQPAQWAEQLA